MSSAHFRQFINYCAVGVLNTGTSYAIYALLTGAHVMPHIALAVSYVCGMALSFLLNARLTFSRSRFHLADAIRFFLVNGLLLALSEGSLTLFLHLVQNADIAQAMNILPITVIGYLLNRFVVFHSPGEKRVKVG